MAGSEAVAATAKAAGDWEVAGWAGVGSEEADSAAAGSAAGEPEEVGWEVAGSAAEEVAVSEEVDWEARAAVKAAAAASN